MPKNNNSAYLVSGMRRQAGAIGIPDNFQIEVTTTSSRNAYVKVVDDSYNGGYEWVQVVAIKMRCDNCGKCHLIVPPDLYLQ